MSDTVSEWRDSFFAARPELTGRPDGRSLFAYRVTDTEFQNLKLALGEKLRAVSSLDFLIKHDPHFAGLFVLYASEWWRRQYQGKRWSWEPIMNDLHFQNGWNSNQRGDCVDRGLLYWQIKRIENLGHRNIGVIARQGGLPVHFLATASGSLGRLLGDVIRLARGGDYPIGTLRTWVASLEERLPTSYRSEKILDLLAEVVATVLELAGSVPATDRTEAVEWLNRNVPNWRDCFPFPMDDRSLQGLLGQLVQDAVTRPTGSPHQCPTVERRLEPIEDGRWTLRSSFDLPERISTEDVRHLFGITKDQPLPRTMVVSLLAGGSTYTVPLHRLAGHDAYRCERRPWQMIGADAVAEHFLSLTSADGCIWNGLPRKGVTLDPRLPWLFAEDGSAWRLVRQGAGGVASAQGVVAVPVGWNVSGDQADMVGRLEFPYREIYRVAGTVRIMCLDTGQSWRVRTADEAAMESDWRWQGHQVWEEFVSPPIGFWERPKLYDGHSAKTGLIWRTWSGHPAELGVYGPLEAHLEASGEIAYRSRMVILPTGARVEYSPRDSLSGVIRMVGWRAIGADICTSGLKTTLREEDDSLNIEMAVQGSGPTTHPPEHVELTLAWPANPHKAKLRLPFPGRGVRAFDGQGHALASDSWLPIHRLTGVRILAVGIDSRLELRLTLRYPKEALHAGPSAQYSIRRPEWAARIEIRLQDFSEEIDRLLSADDVLDAWVEASVTANHISMFTLRLSRYLCPLERLDSNVALTREGLEHIDASALETLPVLALRLETPSDDPVRLALCRSEEVCSGAWAFVTPDREPGTWFIYPRTDAEERFRPTLWTLPGDMLEKNQLSNALAIIDRQARTAELDTVIAALAADYLDPGWKELEYLAHHLGHLPLASLDLWRRFARSAEGMAALAFRLSTLPDGFVKRFVIELPFAWEIVPYRTWFEALERIREQCAVWFEALGALAAQQETSKALEMGLAKIREEFPSVSKLFGILRSTVAGEICKEMELMRNPVGEKIFGDQLLNGEDAAIQRLLRHHANDDWPCDNDVFRLIESWRTTSSLTVMLFDRQHKDYRDSVINLPILLAIQVATDSTGEWFAHPERIHKLRCYRDFDPDWFDEAFDLTIARCLSVGLLKP